MGDLSTSAISGVEARGYRRGTLATDDWDQYVIPVRDRITSCLARAATFRTPGRAAVSQKLMALHNATASPVLINLNRIRVDMLTTVVKAVTVLPPIIRVNKFTAVPTNGTVLAKTLLDTAGATNSAVTVWGDASADGTSSATTLTITAGGVIAQAFAPRLLTAVGYEPLDTVEFFLGDIDVTLRALEGVVIFLDNATVTTGNPATDFWLATIDWEEYTRP